MILKKFLLSLFGQNFAISLLSLIVLMTNTISIQRFVYINFVKGVIVSIYVGISFPIFTQNSTIFFPGFIDCTKTEVYFIGVLLFEMIINFSVKYDRNDPLIQRANRLFPDSSACEDHVQKRLFLPGHDR